MFSQIYYFTGTLNPHATGEPGLKQPFVPGIQACLKLRKPRVWEFFRKFSMIYKD